MVNPYLFLKLWAFFSTKFDSVTALAQAWSVALLG
jgi:hypothetical protein